MMNEMRKQAIVREFPGAAQTVFEREYDGTPRDLRACDGVRIKRIDTELLKFVPRVRAFWGSLCDVNEEQIVSFICANGTVIRDAVWPTSERGSVVGDTERTDGETILEAIARHGVENTLSHIVLVEVGYEHHEHHSTDRWRATVYKPGRYEVAAAVIAAAKQEQNRVTVECDF